MGRVWKRRIHRFMQVVCNPSKMLVVLTYNLDPWVTRRTCISFSLAEMMISAFGFLVFIICRDIDQLGWPIRNWFAYALIMFYRCCCGITGVAGASRRKVSTTRYYFIALAMNIPLTVITAIPFGNCSCECESLSIASPECQVLRYFMEERNYQRLAMRGKRQASEDVLHRSPSVRMAVAVADTVGRAAASAKRHRWHTASESGAARNHGAGTNYLSAWHVAPVNMLLRFGRHLFGTDWIGKLVDTAWRHMERNRWWRRGTSSSAWKSRALGSVSSFLSEDEFNGHMPSDIPVYDYFNITLPGMGWRSSTWRSCQAFPNSFSVYPEETDSRIIKEIRTLFQRLRTGEDLDDKMGGKFFDVRRWESELLVFLSRCIHQDLCGVVGASLDYYRSSEAGPLGRAGYRLNVCMYNHPSYPVIIDRAALRVKYDYIFFQKDVVLSMNSLIDAQIDEAAAMDKCYAFTTTVMLCFILLDLLSLPMLVIVHKFLRRRCGDVLPTERQFSVDWESDDMSEDNFSMSFGGQSRSPTRASLPSASSSWVVDAHSSMSFVGQTHQSSKNHRRSSDTSIELPGKASVTLPPRSSTKEGDSLYLWS